MLPLVLTMAVWHTAALPLPWSELVLEPALARRVEKACQTAARQAARTRYERDRAKTESERARLNNKLAALDRQLADQVRRMLNADQLQQLAQIEQRMAEGVEIGQGIYRSYSIEALGQFSPRIRTSNVTPGGYAEVGVALSIINRSGRELRRGRFAAEAYERDQPHRLERLEFTVEALADGASHRVELTTKSARADHRWEILLLSVE